MISAELDLFGAPIVEGDRGALTRATRPKKTGYASTPGTGPAGKTCRDCEHYCSVPYHNKTWRKCGLLKKVWTHGPGTDIKASSPACEKFEEAKA